MPDTGTICMNCGTPTGIFGDCPECGRATTTDSGSPTRPGPTPRGVMLVAAMVLSMGVSVAVAVGLIGYATYVLVAQNTNDDAIAVAEEMPDEDFGVFDARGDQPSPATVPAPRTAKPPPPRFGPTPSTSRFAPPVTPPPAEPTATGPIADATVAIFVIFPDGERRSGTGLLVGKDNLIVTSRELVTRTQTANSAAYYQVRYTVGPSTAIATATYIKSDPVSGVALLKFNNSTSLRLRAVYLPKTDTTRKNDELQMYGRLASDRVTPKPVEVAGFQRTRGEVNHIELPRGIPDAYLGAPLVDPSTRSVVGIYVSAPETTTPPIAAPANVAGRLIDEYLRPRPVPKPEVPTRPPTVVPTPPARSPITPPTPNVNQVELKLPGLADNACVGGAGRYLIIPVPSERQVIVADTSVGKIVKTLAAPSDKIFAAAGADCLIIIDSSSANAVRYDLDTFEPTVTGKLPIDGHVVAAGMGSESFGPLLVEAVSDPKRSGKIEARFVDPDTLAQLPITLDNTQLRQKVWPGSYRPLYSHVIQANPAGTVFVERSNGPASVIELRGDYAKAAQMPRHVGATVPGPGGLLFAPPSVFTRQLSRMESSAYSAHDRHWIPAEHGPMYLDISEANFVAGSSGIRSPERPKTEIRQTGYPQPLAIVADIGLNAPGVRKPGAPLDYSLMTLAGRVFYFPDAGLIACLPPKSDRLVLTRIDLYRTIEPTQVEYAYIANRPPPVVPGESFDYNLAIRSSAGPGTSVKLVQGPYRMTLSDGRLKWDVPADFAQPVMVKVRLTDQSGNAVETVFDLITSKPAAIKSASPRPQP